ncbi:MAG: transposase [Longimicrobiales bacterium]|nr:transposase [Longimicrobiales bacterium]
MTVWLSDEALDAWRAPASGKPGVQRPYANIAIDAAVTIRMVFHLPLRQTEGFLRSLAELLQVDLPIPDHTTLSRRLKRLGKTSFRAAVNDQPIHLLIDSTGLRIHIGPLRKPPKRRAWRKLHLAVDADTGEIVASDLADRRTVRMLIPPGRDAKLAPRPSAALEERNRNIHSIRNTMTCLGMPDSYRVV